jgi:putative salt-induced outer membrane protein YdiY
MPRFHSAQSNICRLAIWFLLAWAMVSAHASNRDLVIMKNGDRLKGEISKLENGILYFSVDYVVDSIPLDWLQVETVKSPAAFQIVLKDGNHLAGTIAKVPSKEAPGKDFEIRAGNSIVSAAGPDVIGIETRKKNFWRQLTGAMDFGSDFTSGNSQVSLSADANASYSATRWRGGVSFTSSFSGQSNSSKTNLQDGSMTLERFLGQNSSLLGLTEFLHSSQQQLQLRSTLGGGYGQYVFRTNKNSGRWILGAVYTDEQFESSVAQESTQNIEALVGGQYQLLRFNRYNLQSYFFLFPGLSDAGRVRATTKSSLNVKLPNNFYTNVSFWDNYDSRPPITAKKNELGISSGVGWTF